MAGSSKSPRVIALVGPQSSGKTSLLESILCQTGALERRSGAARLIGDASPEAKSREMGTEINVASTNFMDDPYTFLDCPGSLELSQEIYGALQLSDAAIVVTESDPDKIIGMAPLLKHLKDLKIPHYVFINKVDKASGSVRDLATALETANSTPVVLRHIPVSKADEVIGYIDLASERTYVYSKQEPSKVVDLPSELESEVAEARYSMLETLADFDEQLMEQLLEDADPSKEEVYRDLTQDVANGLILPVLIGSALNENGVHRLLKTLRHEVPGVEKLHERLDVSPDGGTLAQIIKTYHVPHTGRISLARVVRGQVKEGDTLNGERPSSLVSFFGEKTEKLSLAEAGQIVGLGRMEKTHTGDTLISGKGNSEQLPEIPVLPPVYSIALAAENRNDEVKLVTSLSKITEEDPSLSYEQTTDTHEIILRGQGEVQFQVASDRLKSKYGVNVTTRRPKVPYKETIKKPKKQHSRYKKQSGGHGQFGDVVVEIQPQPPGSGFSFTNKITGGAIPRQYIPSVETGVKEYLNRGPLGFPVVDVAVTLVDGSYHAVDSSDMAFKTAGRLAMSEALPDCRPVLLEPIMHVKVNIPSEYTGQINGLISGRRGQILGFDAREGWPGWDTVEAHMPQSELSDIIIELRSITLGAGTFTYSFDHLSELTGKLAEQVLQKHQQAAE